MRELPLPDEKPRRGPWECLWPFLAAGLVLASFWALGEKYAGGYVLDLGSIVVPAPLHAVFLAIHGVLGSLAAVLVALGVLRVLASRGGGALARAWDGVPDAAWILVASVLAFAVPVAIRALVLDGAPIVDDESGYRFQAELLAGGALSVPSPPLKLFFDNVFMINDGRLYSQYFLGWPALLVPGVWCGVPGFANAFYSALVVPGVFLVLRRLAGAPWAKLGTLCYLTSPMLMVAAATEMSHTTCLLALVWTTWFVLRSRDDGAGVAIHALVAAVFSVAFFIRPTSTLGIGLPLLAWWGGGVMRRAGAERLRAIAAFAVPAVLMAALFLVLNWLQNGSPLEVAYRRAQTYAAENGYRFSSFTGGATIVGYHFEDPVGALGATAAGLLRLNFAVLGWPLSWLVLLCCGRRPGAGLAWSMALSFVAVHFFVRPGVDTFGPAHYTELAWPVLLLTVLGLERLDAWRPAREARRPGLLAAGLTAGFLVANLTAYAPVRLSALHRIAGNVNAPFAAAAEKGLEDAVVFCIAPWVPQAPIAPTKHFVFRRPNNDPDLENDVLWVNHLTLAEDRRLLERLPGRSGWVLLWTGTGRPRLVPLEDVTPAMLPEGDSRAR